MKVLEGKVAIVTGGARDIGQATSIKLASEGASVVVNYFNDADSGERTVQQIEAAGGKAIAVRADMTQQADVEKLVAATTDEFGEKIDILVNVAGGMVARKTIDEMDLEFFERVMQLNLTSTFLAIKAVAPKMQKGASIVNLASQAGRDGGGPGAVVYATSKGAVMTFTRGMAKELGPKGIRVNALCPGMISTTFHDTFTADAARKNVAAATPLRREGAAEEIANLVCYLASDAASFVHGANIDINGGLLFS